MCKELEYCKECKLSLLSATKASTYYTRCIIMKTRLKDLSKDSEFYCTSCGMKGFSVVRCKNKLRNPGHLKRLYCIKCNKVINHVECNSISEYDYDFFMEEYSSGNFDKDGQRILSLKEWKKIKEREDRLIKSEMKIEDNSVSTHIA